MSEEEKKGRDRRNSEEEPQEETSLGKEILSFCYCKQPHSNRLHGKYHYVPQPCDRLQIVLYKR